MLSFVKKKKKEELMFITNHETLTIGSKDKKNDDINLNGQYFNTEFRVFLDSTGDKNLPDVGDKKDYLLGNGSKDNWYEHKREGIVLNTVENYGGKEEFLKNYKILTTTYLYNSNLWNSWKNWSRPYGKNSLFEVGVYNLKLSSNNQNIQIYSHSDDSHSNNEKTRIILEQIWEGDVLKINFRLGVWYYWAWGSVVHHASLLKLKNDNFIFTRLDSSIEEQKIKTSVFNTPSSFYLNNNSIVDGIEQQDLKIVNKSKEPEIIISPFKKVLTSLHYYTSVKQVGNTVYIYSLILVINPQSINISDSNGLFNGHSISRKIEIKYIGNKFLFKYTNALGQNESSNGMPTPLQFQGVNISGLITTPYIYLK